MAERCEGPLSALIWSGVVPLFIGVSMFAPRSSSLTRSATQPVSRQLADDGGRWRRGGGGRGRLNTWRRFAHVQARAVERRGGRAEPRYCRHEGRYCHSYVPV